MNTIPNEILNIACYSLKKYLPHITPELLQKVLEIAETGNKDNELKAGVLLTVAEAAQRLSVSKPTMWRWIKSKKINTVCLGQRCRRIPESEIIRLGKGE